MTRRKQLRACVAKVRRHMADGDRDRPHDEWHRSDLPARRPESVGQRGLRSDCVHELHIRIARALKLNRALGRGSELIAAEVEAFQG